VAIAASPSLAVVFTTLTALEGCAKAKRILVIIGSGNNSITIRGSGIMMAELFLALMGNGSGYGSNSPSYTGIISSPNSDGWWWQWWLQW
jgi:hypothetical protein